MTRASLSLIAALALAGLASSVLLARPAPPSKASVRAAILDAVYN